METLADRFMSASLGLDNEGPIALLKSAMPINQTHLFFLFLGDDRYVL
jgi:hypothetical protein